MGSPAGAGSDFLGDLRMRDYVRIAKRRKWVIILTAVGLCVASSVMAKRLPNIYKSQTTILVDPQKVPDAYVPTTVSTSVAERLNTLTEQVTSPTLLRQLRDEMHLYPEAQGRAAEEGIVKKMQRSIAIETVNGGHQINAFQIAYSDHDPIVAARMANELAHALIRTNLQAREQEFTGTAEFLDNELQDTKKQLEQKESELAAIKSKYMMDLPESKQFHLEALSTLRQQMQNLQDRINRDQQEKLLDQSMMTTNNPTVDLDTGDGHSSPQDSQIQKLESNLAELRTRYGSNYPDVRKAQAELDALKAKAARQAKNQPAQVEMPETTAGGVRNPVLESQIAKLDEDIKDQTKLEPAIQQQIDFHMSKLGQEPVFEQQIEGLMRDYNSLQEHYNRLLDKKLGAEMASDLEVHQRGENFVILDAAMPPLFPIAPNRPLIGFAGLIGGFLMGIALAMVMEITDESVKNEREAIDIFRAPVLTGVPFVQNPKQTRLSYVRLVLACAATVVAATVVGLVASHFLKGQV
jgi:polysaccharide chain length determinant protein (PEP-CTERM system associated)